MKDVKKNGSLLKLDGYKLTKTILDMTRQELIEELIGSFEYDYLVENNFVEKMNVFEVRDYGLKVLERNGLAWAENPLHPNHDHLTYANGDYIEVEELNVHRNEMFEIQQAVWDLYNVWAMSDERQVLVEEYAKNCKFE